MAPAHLQDPVALEQQTAHYLGRILDWTQRHRFAVLGGTVCALAGLAFTAVAVAPLAPDAAQLPQRMVTQTLEPTGLQAQLEALAAHEIQLTRSDLTRATDTAEQLLARLGVVDASAAAFLRQDGVARTLLSGRGGKLVQAQAAGDNSLIELIARSPSERSELAKTHFTRLTISRTDAKWLTRLETVPYTSQVRLASGTIRSSLFAASDEARVPDLVASQLAEIFSADVDFHRELRKGDTFSVVYEALVADGDPVPWNSGAGRVTAAEFVNAGKAYHAVWFTAADGRSGYYGLDGNSRRRSFLASPMEFSRVTSGFANRFHPILQSWRQHLGVDYGAPMGTPVRSVGEGVVELAGRQNGYGNVVQIRHGNDRSTLYAHLSRMDVRVGQRVEQGQRIGAVGMTGWTTGPHLHFEFRIKGQHQDPLRIAKAAEVVPLDMASHTRFTQVASAVRVKLDLAQTMAGQRMQAE